MTTPTTSKYVEMSNKHERPPVASHRSSKRNEQPHPFALVPHLVHLVSVLMLLSERFNLFFIGVNNNWVYGGISLQSSFSQGLAQAGYAHPHRTR